MAGEDREVSGRVWVHGDGRRLAARRDRARATSSVVGNRADAQRRGDRARRRPAGHQQRHAARRRGARTRAAERGIPIVCSPLDSYVTSRMITLSAPCRALMDPEPLTVAPDDLLSDVAEEVKEVHYRAAVAVDARRQPDRARHPRRPRQPATRAACCSSTMPRQAQSVPGVEQAEIVEILDHHHIGSIETTVPVTRDVRPGRLDRDAGDRALPPERDGAQPRDGDPAARRGPLGHRDPQLADGDRARPTRPSSTSSACWRSTPPSFGREMFDATSDLSSVSADDDRHARRQGVRGRRGPDDLHRAGRDRRARASRAPRRAAGGDATRRASAAATRSTR